VPAQGLQRHPPGRAGANTDEWNAAPPALMAIGSRRCTQSGRVCSRLRSPAPVTYSTGTDTPGRNSPARLCSARSVSRAFSMSLSTRRDARAGRGQPGTTTAIRWGIDRVGNFVGRLRRKVTTLPDSAASRLSRIRDSPGRERTETDSVGKARGAFADLCLTTWLRRRGQ